MRKEIRIHGRGGQGAKTAADLFQTSGYPITNTMDSKKLSPRNESPD